MGAGTTVTGGLVVLSWLFVRGRATLGDAAAAFPVLLVWSAVCAWCVWKLLSQPLDWAQRPRAKGHPADSNKHGESLPESVSNTIADLHGEVELMRKQLINKDEMVSASVHELRTPLTTIGAAIELIRDGHANDPAEQEMFLEQAMASTDHMVFLISDLLDTASLEAGKLRMDLTSCSVRQLFERISRSMTPVAEAKGIRLEIVPLEDDFWVLADENRILQVVFNLLSNALKYSNEDSKVTLRGCPSPAGAVIEVVDQGIGVPGDARRRLFTRFSRVHSSKDSTAAGTGIGLYLSKVLVEHMGGAIGYEDHGDKPGSTFWFTLPLTEDADRETVAET